MQQWRGGREKRGKSAAPGVWPISGGHLHPRCSRPNWGGGPGCTPQPRRRRCVIASSPPSPPPSSPCRQPRRAAPPRSATGAPRDALRGSQLTPPRGWRRRQPAPLAGSVRPRCGGGGGGAARAAVAGRQPDLRGCTDRRPPRAARGGGWAEPEPAVAAGDSAVLVAIDGWVRGRGHERSTKQQAERKTRCPFKGHGRSSVPGRKKYVQQISLPPSPPHTPPSPLHLCHNSA